MRIILWGGALLHRDLLAELYEVKAGDTLSLITLHHYGRPIYGKQGNLAKLIALNAEKISDPNKIFVGTVLDLGEPGKSSRPAVASIPLSAVPQRTRSLATSEETPPTITANALPLPATTQTVGAVVAPEPIVNHPQTAAVNPDAPLAHSQLQLNLRYTSRQIRSTDTTTNASAILGSPPHPTFGLAWIQNWGSQWKSGLGLTFADINFHAPADRNLRDSPSPYVSYRAFSEYQSKWGAWGGTLQYSSLPFVRSLNSTDLAIESIYLPTAKIYTEQILASRNPLALVAHIGGIWFGPGRSANLESAGGWGYCAELSVLQKWKDFSVSAGAFFEKNSLKTAAETASHQEIGVRLNVDIPLNSSKN